MPEWHPHEPSSWNLGGATRHAPLPSRRFTQQEIYDVVEELNDLHESKGESPDGWRDMLARSRAAALPVYTALRPPAGHALALLDKNSRTMR